MSTNTDYQLTIETAKFVDFSPDPRRVWVYEGRNHAVACTDIGSNGINRCWVVEVARYDDAYAFDAGWRDVGEITDKNSLHILTEHYLNAN